MEQQIKPELVGGDALSKAMNEAVLGAALSDDENALMRLKNEEKSAFVKGGAPGPGRPKGHSNRVTRTIREAVEAASQPGACHEDGLAGWLIDRAKGSLGDRQIFAAMVNKAMPLQVQANVDGGIRLELSWLGARQIGTATAQIPEQRTQVLDLQQENDGSYRIKDQQTPAAGGTDPAAPTAQKAAGDAQGQGQ